MHGPVRDPGYATSRVLHIVIIWADDLHLLQPISIPTSRCTYAAAVARKVNQNGVTLLNCGVVDEMGHEALLYGVLRSFFVGEKAYLVAGNVEIVCEPTFDAVGIVYAGIAVPDTPGSVLVNANHECEQSGSHSCRLRKKACRLDLNSTHLKTQRISQEFVVVVRVVCMSQCRH